MQLKDTRVHYSEEEAAARLGLSVEQLRGLVRSHISKDDDIPAVSTFRPTDLVLLRILATGQQGAAQMSA